MHIAAFAWQDTIRGLRGLRKEQKPQSIVKSVHCFDRRSPKLSRFQGATSLQNNDTEPEDGIFKGLEIFGRQNNQGSARTAKGEMHSTRRNFLFFVFFKHLLVLGLPCISQRFGDQGCAENEGNGRLTKRRSPRHVCVWSTFAPPPFSYFSPRLVLLHLPRTPYFWPTALLFLFLRGQTN